MYKLLSLLLIISMLSIFGCSKNKDAKINYREIDRKALEIMDVAKDHHKKKNYWRARWYYKKVINKYPKSNYADDAQFYIARVFHEDESYWRAVEAYGELVDMFPASDRIPESAQYLFEIGEYYWNDNEKYDAIETYKKAIEIYPFGKFAPDVQSKIANYYFDEKEYEDAITHFDKLIRLYPYHPNYKDAFYKLGISYFNASLMWSLDQNLTNKSIMAFSKYIETYPDDPKNAELKTNIEKCKNRLAEREHKTGDFYLNYEHYDAAIKYYKSVLAEYPESPWAEKSQFGIAETLKEKKMWQKSILAYQKLLEDYPKSDLTEKAIDEIDYLRNKIAEKQ